MLTEIPYAARKTCVKYRVPQLKTLPWPTLVAVVFSKSYRRFCALCCAPNQQSSMPINTHFHQIILVFALGKLQLTFSFLFFLANFVAKRSPINKQKLFPNEN